MDLPNIYLGNYKLLVAVPIILVLASILLIAIPGSPFAIKKGVDFKGGTLVTMQADQGVVESTVSDGLTAKGFQVSSVKSLPNPKGYEIEIEIERDDNLTQADTLKSSFFDNIDEVSRLESDVTTSNQSSDSIAKYTAARQEIDATANSMFAIEGAPQNASAYSSSNDLKNSVSAAYKAVLDNYSAKLSNSISALVPYQTISFNTVSASLSAKFIDRALMVVIYSTVLVSIVVFVIFRTLTPSLAVLTGAASDVLIALGAMGLFGIPLTLASFAALLMLIGFSLDTDVLLTMRVIKRKEGTARQRAYETMKTGLTMSMALLLSFGCLFVLAVFTHINTYFEISAVAIAGLVGDVFATWMLDAVIVLMYAEKKGDGGEHKPFLSSIFSN